MKPFTDDNGKTYDIEVRGKRNYVDCYFLAQDIAVCFGLNKLEYDLTRKITTQYSEGIHYRWFTKSKRPITTEKRLFLSYKGLVKLIFRSNSPKADSFTDWVCQIVFTMHLGTVEQKIALTSDLIGIKKENVKQYFDTCIANVSGLYLIRLGTVKDLRAILGISEEYPDDMYVYKYA